MWPFFSVCFFVMAVFCCYLGAWVFHLRLFLAVRKFAIISQTCNIFANLRYRHSSHFSESKPPIMPKGRTTPRKSPKKTAFTSPPRELTVPDEAVDMAMASLAAAADDSLARTTETKEDEAPLNPIRLGTQMDNDPGMETGSVSDDEARQKGELDVNVAGSDPNDEMQEMSAVPEEQSDDEERFYDAETHEEELRKGGRVEDSLSEGVLEHVGSVVRAAVRSEDDDSWTESDGEGYDPMVRMSEDDIRLWTRWYLPENLHHLEKYVVRGPGNA